MADSLAKLLFLLVPEAGLEPAQGCPYRILSPARLPFHHSGTRVNIDNQHSIVMQVASSLFNIRSSPVFARCESNQRFSRRWIVGSKILPARS
jgi:hypothetical protein